MSKLNRDEIVRSILEAIQVHDLTVARNRLTEGVKQLLYSQTGGNSPQSIARGVQKEALASGLREITQVISTLLQSMHPQLAPQRDPQTVCCGFERGMAPACCDRAGEYNGYGSDGPRLFECPKGCACHD